ncbi:MAG TPA: hypothetical protein VKF40_03415 [Burkholderiales bacterium]|nr:hypothetical protein [Burkholderiales bacterium]
MKRAPTLAAIHAAELRVVQSERRVRDATRRLGAALRAELSRPSVVAVIAGVGGLCGIWLARRAQTKAPQRQELHVAGASLAGLLAAGAMRFVARLLPVLIRQAWSECQKEVQVGPYGQERP